MIYLLLGKDTAAKEIKITQIKDKVLKSPEARQFDYETLSAHKLDADTLKQALDALPAVDKQRFLLIREAENLNAHNKDLIVAFAETKAEHLVLVLDAFAADARASFFKKISAGAEIATFDTPETENVFDMTRAMGARQPAQALKILNGILTKGDHPLQILGALVWFWGKNKPRLSLDRFQRGLNELQEADLNIKRSRLKPEYTLEILVVKLCSLTA